MFDVYFRGVYESEEQTFDVYFASVSSMQSHPGAGTKEHVKLTIEECSQIAIDMLIERRKVFTGLDKKEVN